LIVLADNPESLSAPAPTQSGVAVQFIHADRSNFLALAQSFIGKTNPAVIIAFGHGGKQGMLPCFTFAARA